MSAPRRLNVSLFLLLLSVFLFERTSCQDMSDPDSIMNYCNFDWGPLWVNIGLFSGSFQSFVDQVNSLNIYDASPDNLCNVYQGWFQWMDYAVQQNINCLNPRSTFCSPVVDQNDSPLPSWDPNQPWCQAFWCTQNNNAYCQYWDQSSNMAGQGQCYDDPGCVVNCLRMADNTGGFWSGQLVGEISWLFGNYLGAESKRKRSSSSSSSLSSLSSSLLSSTKGGKKRKRSLWGKVEKMMRRGLGERKKRQSFDSGCPECGCDGSTPPCDWVCSFESGYTGMPCWNDWGDCCTCLLIY